MTSRSLPTRKVPGRKITSQNEEVVLNFGRLRLSVNELRVPICHEEHLCFHTDPGRMREICHVPHTTHLSPGQATEALLHGYRGAVAFVS
ncbi:RGD1565482 (predicted), partial [Rattus norvegicus]